ncbi:hypothetical protein MSUIS_06140 [Mycoplasma suis KI3806]|uniref:Uncharacterized protein n=2 Tax=Mycoplasma suis TaxID=57372 RepID=F0V226_MYCS3|nr:hypothetical protein MSUIS_06140 [Mycoplasma suis KI3806]
MTPLAKVAGGLLAAGAASSGLVVGGYQLKKMISPEKSFKWEYYLKTGNKEECKRFGKENEETKCDTLWSSKVRRENIGNNVIGWWIIGEEEVIDSMLSQWWENQRNDLNNKELSDKLRIISRSASYLSMGQKCQINKREGDNRIEISCKFERGKDRQ